MTLNKLKPKSEYELVWLVVKCSEKIPPQLVSTISPTMDDDHEVVTTLYDHGVTTHFDNHPFHI